MRAGFAQISTDEFIFFKNSGCRHDCFLTYAALCSFRGKNNKTVWPAVEKLCEMTGKPRRTTIRDISALRDAGLIKTKRRRNASSMYTFAFFGLGSATHGTSKEKSNQEVPPGASGSATQCIQEVPPTAQQKIPGRDQEDCKPNFSSSLENLPPDLAKKISSAKSAASSRKKKP